VSPIQYDNLFRLHRQRVFGFAFHYLGNEDDAADVTQEVFIRLWRNRRSIEADRLTGWLLRVTRNLCVDAYRKKTTRLRYISSDSDGIEDHGDRRPKPDSIAAGSLFNERLQTALKTLGEPHRSILMLREIEEFKYEEISDALDLPLNTVKVYLHRARRALRKELSEALRYEYVE